MLLSGARLDPSAIAAAALAETSDGGLVAWWVGEEVTLLECDADLFALVTGALPDAALDAPRTFAPTGAIVTSAWLEVGPEGLTYPTQFVRGGGWSKTETLAWDEVGRVTVVDQGFVLVRRRDEELVNTGATGDSKLAPIVSASVARARGERSAVALPVEAVDAIARLSVAESGAPFRDAPAISDALLRVLLARADDASRALAADALERRGALPSGAASFVRRGRSNAKRP